VRRDTGVTPIVLEADTHDLRLVSVDHIRSQIREFLEQRRAGAPHRNGSREAAAH
jgi:hypothetical protein